MVKEFDAHDYAAAYNELKSIKAVSLVTGKSEKTIEASLRRHGYKLYKEYRLEPREEIKRRWQKLLNKRPVN